MHATHLGLGAKMGEFAGYDMPLYYAQGVIKEHEWTRTHAGLFDVSHMGQVMITGPGALRLIENLTPSSFATLPDGRAKYTVLTNAQGGIIDDLIISRLGPETFFAVVNAGRKDVDVPWMQSHLSDDVIMRVMHDRALIALQGPMAETILRDVTGYDAVNQPYMWTVSVDDYYISRLGYTGEDGFEISVPNDVADALWQKFIAHPDVRPVGLAARDGLRLEMGYPLYGHELNEELSPVEAGLTWVIGRDRLEYIGADRIMRELSSGVSSQRVGIRLTDKGIAREGAEIRTMDNQVIGKLTSGGYSPILKESIGMGYVPNDYAAPGTKLFVTVRDKNIAAEICVLPMLPPKTKSIKSKS